MCSTINIVTEEQIVVALDITIIVRVSPEIEESHKVLILSVDITEHFNWSIDAKYHGLLL